ncbi:grasp-with-spasm system SPASM domain peptide maturase [Chitinophaga rhizophila]|uniref:Grasp-with-spasm system SPASM domain peptide maturase n=1 Tax=Chitinophaga rhizophila TaxID=2866212 RepID=A0ABS7GJU3_9BACT|nr:grasp-with-spasm system SPASM domain peptide maturase [Chitinophaga rhizophila]MBW8687985.1 grasp-with-spasm system SPASM domain peptide maturase [Chitinophaga rhizophila]
MEWFRFFASCRIVAGKYSSAIYDLDRSVIYDLPNAFLEVIREVEVMPLEQMPEKYGPARYQQIKQFLDKFVEKELAFYTTSPECFPDIDLTWEKPWHITNAVLELDDTASYSFDSVIKQLNELGCQAIQVRLGCNFSTSQATEQILKALASTQINFCELMTPHNDITAAEWISLMDLQPRLRRVYVYAAPDDAVLYNDNERYGRKIVSFKKDIRRENKEKIRLERFSPNILSFTEAQSHNLGLNRKVAIDSQGYIRNYISHPATFGHVNEHLLADVTTQPAFREKWFLPNDWIEGCKDCQYRYTCVSNSDIRKENDKYYKTEMCTFNQQDNTW